MTRLTSTAALGALAYLIVACSGGPPTARMAAACAATNSDVFFIGGIPKSGRTTDVVEQYALPQRAWTRRAPMPTPRATAASVMHGGRLYVIGGRNESGILNVVESYDVASDTWATEAPMPSPVWNAMAAAVANKIYVFGGLVGTGDQRQTTDEVKAYDPTQRSWSTGPRMPQGKQNAAIAIFDGKIYIIGGMTGSAGLSGSSTNAVDVFDPASGRWQVAAPMSAVRTGSKAIVVDGRIYAVGGARGGEAIDTSEIYDPRANTWQPGPQLKARRTGHCVEFVAGRGLVVGGASGAETRQLIANVEELSFSR